MKNRNFAMFSVLAAALVLSTVATLPMAPEDASAYEKNQATSQTSACGNEFMPINIGCQNTDSQVQGDENAAALTAQQTFPEVKLVQEKPTPEPTPEPTPMTATLQVCKDAASTAGTYEFIVTGNNPSPEQFSLMPGDCQDVTVGAGDYLVTEEFEGDTPTVTVSGECAHMIGTTTAGGNIQAGDTQSCNFLNIEEEPQTCIECFTKYLTPEQITALEALINPNPPYNGNFEDTCTFWHEAATPEEIALDLKDLSLILELTGVDDTTAEQLIDCLERVLGLQTESETIES